MRISSRRHVSSNRRPPSPPPRVRERPWPRGVVLTCRRGRGHVARPLHLPHLPLLRSARMRGRGGRAPGPPHRRARQTTGHEPCPHASFLDWKYTSGRVVRRPSPEHPRLGWCGANAYEHDTSRLSRRGRARSRRTASILVSGGLQPWVLVGHPAGRGYGGDQEAAVLIASDGRAHRYSRPKRWVPDRHLDNGHGHARAARGCRTTGTSRRTRPTDDPGLDIPAAASVHQAVRLDSRRRGDSRGRAVHWVLDQIWRQISLRNAVVEDVGAGFLEVLAPPFELHVSPDRPRASSCHTAVCRRCTHVPKTGNP